MLVTLPPLCLLFLKVPRLADVGRESVQEERKVGKLHCVAGAPLKLLRIGQQIQH